MRVRIRTGGRRAVNPHPPRSGGNCQPDPTMRSFAAMLTAAHAPIGRPGAAARPRVCHVCSAHPVGDFRVFHRLCVALADAGYEVHLIATGERGESYTERGVVVHPLREPATRAQRLARRSTVARLAARLDPDLFHVHEPELLGPVLAHSGSAPVVWDVHESYLDIITERAWIPRWLKPFARTVWDWRERRLVQRCAAVVPTSEWIAARYRPLHERVVLVCNFPDLAWIESLPPVIRDGRTCVYAGLITPNRGLSSVVRALGILKTRGLEVALELAGIPDTSGYLEALLDEARVLGVDHLVRYHGVLPLADAIALQHRASIGVVTSLPEARNNQLNVPVKLMDLMALGLPTVFSDFPNNQELAGVHGAGIAVDPTRPEDIADGIARLVKDPDLARRMGAAGRRAIRERFNWSVERAKLLALYEDLLGSSRSPA
jgi:glycosyltransferase involved in cell wall biosynthesis